MERKGDWLSTYTGRQFWPLDPCPEDICIEDVAHALSLLCRFGGHCKEFYSVAQHCCLGALWGRYGELLPKKKDQFNFLMHDASEAYLVDLPRPIKRGTELFGEMYQQIESKLEEQLAIKFDLDWPLLPAIKNVDIRMLLTEKRDLLPNVRHLWQFGENDYPPFTAKITPWIPEQAENTFLAMFRELS